MKIGIIVAVVREFKSFLQDSFDFTTETISNREVCKFNVNNNEVFITQSGAGIIDASSATQFLITKYDCEIILNYGVTGCLTKGISVGNLFIVDKVCHYELDTSPIDPILKYQYIEFKDQYIPMDSELIRISKTIEPDLINVICASGSKFIVNKDEKIKLHQETKASICDMEIAGIARTCFKNNVRCLSIKCISDDFDGDGNDFEKNIVSSGEKAFKVLKKILFAL